MEHTENNDLGNFKDIPSNKPSRTINKKTRKILNEYGDLSSKVNLRLEELDKEWDLEKTLEINASAAILTGMILGTVADKKWYLLPTAVAGFLLQKSLVGWSVPKVVFRFLGFRSKREIEEERQSLMALRGDYDVLHTEPEPITPPNPLGE
jgi:hypothetical protein